MVVFSPIFVADTKIIYGYDFVAPLTLDALHICGALRDLVPFVQFKLREKYPWRSVNFSKVAGLLKLTLLHGCFSSFLSCTNGTKSPNASQIVLGVYRVDFKQKMTAGLLRWFLFKRVTRQLLSKLQKQRHVITENYVAVGMFFSRLLSKISS